MIKLVLKLTVFVAVLGIKARQKSLCLNFVGWFRDILRNHLPESIRWDICDTASLSILVSTELWGSVIKFVIKLREAIHVRGLSFLIEFVILELWRKLTLALEFLVYVRKIFHLWWRIRLSMDLTWHWILENFLHIRNGLAVIRRSWPCLSLFTFLMLVRNCLSYRSFSHAIPGWILTVSVEPDLSLHLPSVLKILAIKESLFLDDISLIRLRVLLVFFESSLSLFVLTLTHDSLLRAFFWVVWSKPGGA